MCISGLCLSVFCAACYSEKALFTSESSIFILKAIFFLLQAYNKWPEMDETCNFWWKNNLHAS